MALTHEKDSLMQSDVLTGTPPALSADRQARIGSEIIAEVLADYHGGTAIILWDGTLAHGAFDAPCTAIFREPGALRDLILHRDLLRLADSYLTGAIDLEGDLERLFDLKTHLAGLNLSLGTRLHLLRLALRLPKMGRTGSMPNQRAGRSLRKNSRTSIAHHYDVGNDFYGLWLDPEMVYSCAYFKSVEQSLAEAQRDKLDYLCRKLRLQPGQTLLDIGCGWGALALWAARHYGVRVHGITLSKEQSRLARERTENAGMEEQVRIELLDYRDLPQDVQYDRVVSVGMFEHVGLKNFPAYFGTVRRVLKPDGLFLNHGITNEAGWESTAETRFMNHYVFPDGELTRISDVCDAMECAGFEILDVEGLRRHYALTLRRWVNALETKRREAIAYSSEVTYRLWRLYMAGCAFQFEAGGIGVYQVIAGQRHQPQPVPLRREDLYARSGADEEKLI